MTSDSILLREALRRDFASFVARSFQTVSPGIAYMHAWYIEAMAWHLTQCAHGRIKRLLITLPPRSLKSITASVAFPAWLLGRDSSARIICASYSSELSAKHARDGRAIMESRWYRELFPTTRIDPSKNAELELTTTKKGFRYGTSVDGTLTGRGGQFIILDDPLKPSDALSEAKRTAVCQWFENTLYSRLDSKRDDVIIVVQQRVHAEDLVGYLLSKGEDWVHLDLPAIAEERQVVALGPDEVHVRREGDLLHPEREPREVLERVRAAMGTFAFSSQYQQRPIPPEGNLLRWDWFRLVDTVPQRQAGDVVAQSWDTASKAEQLNDYSVCTTWLRRDKNHYLVDVYRRRLEYPALKRAVLEQAERHKPDSILIEDKGTGTSLLQELRQHHLVGIVPEGDKVTRMATQSGKIEAGKVNLPRQAPWLEDFQREVLQFPEGRYDDQVDSLSQYLGWVKEYDPANWRVIMIKHPMVEARERGEDPLFSPLVDAYYRDRSSRYGGDL
jgi:predicted phage terminase large subunit-like protein